MKAIHTSQDPIIIRRFPESLDVVSGFPYFKIKYKVTGMTSEYVESKLYYVQGSNSWSENNKQTFNIITDGNWHEAIISMVLSSSAVSTSIDAIRLDIPNNSNGSSCITYIKYFGFFHTYKEAEDYTVSSNNVLQPTFMWFSSGNLRGRMTLTSMRIDAMQVGSLANPYTITMSEEFAEAMRAYYNGSQPLELMCSPTYPQGAYSMLFDYDRKEVYVEFEGGEDGYDLPTTTILFGY